ncbi:hypothetical protein Bca52824_065099 [Brassica carinata]|uniref:Uncharacterized protein n=1 Tax=Brassica carinata TaxID=52824 RepID=A0A8X7QHP0_BRACI|nr:hypothetical protein Bca52824_065099 [Brassica carinata]
MRNGCCWWTRMKIGKLLWCRSYFVGKHSNLRTFQVVTSRFPKFKVPDAAHEEELFPLRDAREIYNRCNTALKLKIFLLPRNSGEENRNAREVKGKRKTVGTRHVGKKCCLGRSGGGKEVTKEVSRKNTPSSERESGHQNDDDHAKENEYDNARFPPSGGNKGDQQQETQSNALALFGDVLVVEPESYVLPAEHAVTSPGAWQKRNPMYRYEQGSPVTWEKTKPNCYSSVGSARSFHPSWDGNPSSKSKNDGERLEQVSAPMGIVEALVKEINSEIPGADEEIRATRGGEGAQPKENELVAARMTPTAGIDFAQKTGADNGGESGQTSNQNDGERLEQVSAPMGFVEALVKEINSETPGDEPKENKSVAARDDTNGRDWLSQRLLTPSRKRVAITVVSSLRRILTVVKKRGRQTNSPNLLTRNIKYGVSKACGGGWKSCSSQGGWMWDIATGHSCVITSSLKLLNRGNGCLTRKRCYAALHQPSVLKKCDVSEMEDGSSHVKYAKVVSLESFISNVSVLATERQSTMKVSLQHQHRLEESIKILEPNVPMHGFSTLAVAIFNVCLGNDKEAKQSVSAVRSISP